MKIERDLLTVNEWSRPGRKLVEVLGIIFHWVGNPETSAQMNRDYFESRKNGKLGYGSAHAVIDMDGGVVQTIPDDEVAYHVGSAQLDPMSGRVYTDWARARFGRFAKFPEANSPNNCTIGIEMCHIDWAGHFTSETIKTATDLAVTYCAAYKLDPFTQIGTHFGTVGWKKCPRLWSNQPELLKDFRVEVKRRMEEKT